MTTFRSLDNLSQAMLDFLRTVQPDLDTKPGTVSRDLFVDLPATEFAKLYIELRNISNLQSIASASGVELDKLGRNFGLARKTGSFASGLAVFTVNTLEGSIFIPAGTLVSARNGVSFRTLSDVEMDSNKSNIYRANATRMRSDLSLAGIIDEFALEVTVESTTLGPSGNVGKYGIISQSISGISNVTNITSFSGGSGAETDDQFRARILSIYAGSNLGTALGYENTIRTDTRVIDVLTVEPGDPLMTRDGTQTITNSSGEKIIISSGTGGKVDIYVQGSALEEFTESYIYKDLSGKNDPTSSLNDYIIGQRNINPLLDYQQKRRLLFAQGTLPSQPIDSIISISGSLSGSNFVEKFVDTDGSENGNFELIKDEGAFGGSVFGFDKIHFISKNISLQDESLAKGIFNGQDGLDYTDVSGISSVYENVIVANENSAVSSSDRSILTLNHKPVVTVDRVVNLTTGDRYSVINQNVDGVTGELNTTGRIQIAGSSLPLTNHILQVSYVWKNEFDNVIDYDDLVRNNPLRTAQDSIDWGYANRVLAEQHTVNYSVDDGYHVLTEMPISRVVNVNQVNTETVLKISGKLVVSNPVLSISSVKDESGNEVYYTNASNGSFSGFEITLPSDSLLADSDLNNYPDGYVYATVTYNSDDIYSPDGYDTGSFSGNLIRLADDVVAVGSTVFVDYIADVSSILPATPLSNLPATGMENEFIVNSATTGNQPLTNIYDISGNIERTLRFAPTALKLNISNTSAVGRLAIRGISYTKVEQIIPVKRDGLKIDVSDAIRATLGSSAIPSTCYVAMVDSIEKVSVSDESVITDFVFDILNYSVKTTTYSNGTSIADASLATTEVLLRSTDYNTGKMPVTGEKLKVILYIVDTNFTERITISAGGTAITQRKYVYIDRISIDSGFIGLSNTVEGSFSIEAYTQPAAGTAYFCSYDFVSPKEGERLTIKYRHNRLISDLMFALEAARPITADVLIKAATSKSIDVELEIVPTSSFINNTSNLQQNVQEAITTFLTANGLNTIVDQSDVINTVYSVTGVDRVVITKFNESGLTGVVKSIVADRSEFITAGTIVVNIGSR